MRAVIPFLCKESLEQNILRSRLDTTRGDAKFVVSWKNPESGIPAEFKTPNIFENFRKFSWKFRRLSESLFLFFIQFNNSNEVIFLFKVINRHRWYTQDFHKYFWKNSEDFPNIIKH